MTQRRIDYCLIGLLALILMTAPWLERGEPHRAMSEHTEEAVRRVLISIQKDRGGRISRRNLMDAVKSEFERLDRDRNGLLDPSELRTVALPVPPDPEQKSGN